MGNEMGNNNTSGLKEDNTLAIDSKNLFNKAADADNVKGENQTVPTVPEAKDFHEKVTGLASDDPTEAKDPHIENERPGGREQEENEVHPPTESPKAVMESIEASSQNNEIRPAPWQKDSEVPPPTESPRTVMESIEACSENNETRAAPTQKDLEVHPPTESPKAVMESIETCSENNEKTVVHEKTVDSILEEILLVTSDHKLQKQSPVNEEQEENEVHPSDESLKAAKSIEAIGEHNEIKPASSPNDSEVHEMPIDSNLEENILGTSHHQLEKQAPISEEEERTRNSTFNTESTPNDPEPQQSLHLDSDQHALDEVNANLSEEDSSNPLQGNEDFLGSSLECASEENSHFLGPDISNNLSDNPIVEKKMGESFGKEAPSQEEKMPHTQKIEIMNGDNVGFDLSSLTTRTSDTPRRVGDKSNEELSIKDDSIRSDSLNLQLENRVLDNSLNSHQEVSEPEDKCMVLTEETKIIGSGSEIEEAPHEYNATQFCEEPVKEAKTEIEDYEMRSLVDISSNLRSTTKDCQIEEVKVAENACQVGVCVSNQNKTSDGHNKGSEQELLVVSERETVPIQAELIVTDCRCEEGQPEEKKIVEEVEDKAEASYATVNDTEGSKTTKQCLAQPLLIEQAEAFLSQISASMIRIQEVHESLERNSTESNPDNMNTHAYVQMRKSRSFDFDLRVEARGKESDQTPLLFQDKAAMERSSSQADVLHVGYNQDVLQYQLRAMEEKVITLERSDSEKSRTPFLGLLKEEEEEDQIVVTPRKQEATRELCNLSTKEAASTPPKGKEKRKPRSSFFGNCMCCAAVIN
ncbi:uncharacterized protein LOC133874925 isoform X2 [Alnus glutinosa]|uniref:uncharacterized protein LOC133874925 isoform X2 n=1 Tax=Alnus glutinosa TaxID=3517 RepID=UPI002D785A6A|nr:uncharacterized protein LOC133874925 isoform X2 [Alnus glutinosa]